MADTERTGISGRDQRGSGSTRTEIKELQDGTGAANESGDRSEVRGTPTHIDLFSGIGGFALAAQWAGFRTIAFCEIDKYCQKVLAKNFSNASLNGCGQRRPRRLDSNGAREQQPAFHENIFDFDGTRYRGCDLLTGGFPCQPFSVAGKRRGAADDRAIWPEMFRVIKEARPAWVLGENVPGIIPMELDNVLSDMEGIGYAARPFVIPACAVDAKHRRDRLWIIGRYLGNAGHSGLEGHGNVEVANSQGWQNASGHAWASSGRDSVADANATGLQERSGQRGTTILGTDASDRAGCCQWEPEPYVGRVANGIHRRVDRLKGLGNAIVPQVAYEILREIRRLI